jgi:hypothetical protein
MDSAAGPTSTGYNETTGKYKPVDWTPRSGYQYEARDTGIQVREGSGGEGDFVITYKPPPRDLEAMADVVESLNS